MFIINQDRDCIIQLQETSKLNYEIITKDNIFIGYNLLIDGIPIGTFDTINDLENEINNIYNCKYTYYITNGFSDYKNCFIGGSIYD